MTYSKRKKHLIKDLLDKDVKNNCLKDVQETRKNVQKVKNTVY
jgi:hypothetical protein